MAKKNILIAFFLNFLFAIFELLGGLFCGSIAIISDSIHDIGDAASIGISFFLEKLSNKAPDKKYSYGYRRYSLLGSMITLLILILGGAIVIFGAVNRILNPKPINYDYMLIFAIVGVVINFLAAFFTSHGNSLNQKAVNLHMLEDCFGWAVVLVGAIIMKFTDISVIDPIMSIFVSVVIIVSSVKALSEVLSVIMLRVPKGIDTEELCADLESVDGVLDIHHIHIWSIDGEINYATLHAVIDGDGEKIKENIRSELKEHNISHVTIETENKDYICDQRECVVICEKHTEHHHHHHH